MTAEEETVLKEYLVRTGAISNPDEDFEEWHLRRHEGPEGEAEYKATLAESHAYALGVMDATKLAMVRVNSLLSEIEQLHKTYNEMLVRQAAIHREEPPEGMIE